MKARLLKPEKLAAVAETAPKNMQWGYTSDWLRPSVDCMDWYTMTSSATMNE